MFKTANPALKSDVFAKEKQFAGPASERMTVSGTINKTGFLLLILIATASLAWRQPEVALSLAMPLLIAGFIVAMVTIFKKQWAPITAPLYAAIEGYVIGALSLFLETQYPGIVIQAAMGTFGTLFALLTLYRAGLIRATEKFKTGVMAATGGIAFIYILSMILGFFGVQIPYLHDSSPMGIGISVVIVIVASLNLILDFDFIENGAKLGAPKYMEWYAGFGLLVTLIWLYMEILRLLSKLRSR